MSSQLVVYPTRLTFINKGACCVCDKESENNIHIMSNHFLGWTSCNNEICNKIIQNWCEKITKTKEDIISQFGIDKVNIKRSNNRLESGWIISSDARQEEKDGEYWIKVRSKNNSKEVKLSDMLEWNK